jgi:hypothetical protein
VCLIVGDVLNTGDELVRDNLATVAVSRLFFSLEGDLALVVADVGFAIRAAISVF